MRMIRLLLPFSHGVDARAIDHVLFFAKASHATLVALALIPAAQPDGEDVRLERIQQARDFLETIATKAEAAQLNVERHECFTANILECIESYVQEANCEGIVMLSDAHKTYFLSEDEAQLLQQNSPCSLYRLSMIQKKKASAQQQPLSHLWSWFSQQDQKHVQGINH